MAGSKLAILLVISIACVLIPSALSITFGEKAVANQVKIDATWIDKDARDQVDILFVMDRSGSVRPSQFVQAKSFVKNFLEYFSIAPLHTQVGVILFENVVSYPIVLKYDNHKCQFMKDLNNMPTNTGGGTNAKGGLDKALQILRSNSRRNVGAKPVVVFITDGDWNAGGDPAPTIAALKAEKTLLIVITIGNPRRKQEMLGWASPDVRGKPMAFAVESFTAFANIAKYIHKGLHSSKYIPIPPAECGSRCTKPADCVCDTLAALGKPTCACPTGKYVKTAGAKETCDSCLEGQYYEEAWNVFKKCKFCPAGQTTLSKGSQSANQCVCKKGFWNPSTKLRKPPCAAVTCTRDSIQALDQNSIALKGSCTYAYSQSCNYECHSGFITAGVTKRTCMENGQMNPPPAKCHALQCPIMPKVPNSSGYKCVNKGQVQSGKYPYKTECKNECAAGYLPRPGTSQFVICGLDPARTNGKWSGSALVCEPQTCTNLPEVLNGQYNLPECSNVDSDRVFGKVCSVQCNHGYLLTEDVKWTCQSDGQWSNYAKTVFCKDVREPEFLQCPQHITVDNEEKQGYALVQLKPLEAFDNDASGGIKQTMNLKLYGSSTGIEYPCDKVICGEKSFNFPIGTSTVNFTASDRSGNSANCIFQVTVRDTEPPTVVQCDGPVKDEKGFIFTDNDEADIQWKTPKFADNSGQEMETFSTGSPGTYRVGRTWTITYTAKDKAGNTAKCEFSFKLSGIKCPQLHLPANGAMVCDKLAFGVYCVPQCQKGLTRLLPDEIARIPVDYFCSVKGKWLPHDTVGDCSLRTPVTPDTIAQYEFTWFEGNCNDEQTKQSIIQNTLDALEAGGPSFIGVGFKDSQDGKLTKDDFEVFCGPKNESIVQIGGGARRRRAIGVQPQAIKMYGSELGSN